MPKLTPKEIPFLIEWSKVAFPQLLRDDVGMFKEAIEFIFTPTTPLAKKYGFLYQSIALKHRYERCRNIWIPHLKACQDLFTRVASSVPHKNHVVVLGSAHLHEIPLHLLRQQFERITLVDIHHPLKHHRIAKKDPNLQIETLDLSGLLDQLETLKTLEDLHSTLQDPRLSHIFSFEADLVISSNILSQLGLLPIEYIEKKIKRTLTTSEKDQICTSLAQLHLKNLAHCSGVKLIYADRKVIYRAKDGTAIYEGSYPVDTGTLQKIKEWTWTLAPLGEASKDYTIEMQMEAWQG